MSTIVVGVAVVGESKLLMVQEAQKKCYGQWNLPAGHLDEGETFLKGAVREAKEETGYDVELTGLVGIFTSKGDYPQIVIFAGEVVGGGMKFDEEEILDVKWIPFEELAEMDVRLPAGDFEIIMDRIQNGKIYPLEIVKESSR